MSLDLQTFDSAIKELYNPQKIEDLVYKNNPYLAMVPKFEGFVGRNLRQPLIYGSNQGRSADFSRAQTRAGVTQVAVEDFVLTRARNFSLATVDHETVLATKGNAGAFMEALQTQIDSAMRALTNDIATSLFRSGWGDIGRSATAAGASNRITLQSPSDVVNFEVGMELVFSSAQSSAALRAFGSSGNGLFVTAIDRDTGVITVNANTNDATNGCPTLAVGDWIFIRGDRQDSSTPTIQKIVGLGGWLPESTPASNDSFFGVNRSLDATRLAGIRYNGVGQPIEEALIEATQRIGREGGMPDTVLMSFKNYASLVKALSSKVMYTTFKVGEIGFKGMQLHGANTVLNVLADRSVPDNRIYVLQLDTWRLNSLGKLVSFQEEDGLTILRQPNASGYEVRLNSFAQLGCSAPGFNGVILL